MGKYQIEWFSRYYKKWLVWSTYKNKKRRDQALQMLKKHHRTCQFRVKRFGTLVIEHNGTKYTRQIPVVDNGTNFLIQVDFGNEL